MDFLRIVVCCGLLVGASSVANSDDSTDLHPYLENGFSLDLGIFYPDRQLDLRVNGSVEGINKEIDFDERLKLKKGDETFSAQLSWRFGDRWSVLGQYFKSSDGRRAELEEDVEWGNVVFGAGSFAAMGNDFSLTRMFVGRHLDTSERHEVGIGGGIHWLKIGAFIEGEIEVNGKPSSARRSVSEEAPLPNVGIWYDYSISRRWAFRSRFDLLSADIGRYDGILINTSLGINYQVFENFGIGLNYNYFELDVNINKSNWKGNTEITYQGAYLYASVFY